MSQLGPSGDTQSSSAPRSSAGNNTAEPKHAWSMDRDEPDDEWEYEYDVNETEHFYVTLDLTSRVPPQQRRRRTSLSDSDPATHDPPLTPSSPDGIQILDLHSKNPLVAHQNKLYSCHWASAIGTDLLFTLPVEATSPVVPVAPELEHATASARTPTSPPSVPPLRKTADYTILAATPHRLVCVPAVRKPKLDADDGPSLADRPQRLHENSQRAAQATFLQQLADLKMQKGQTDSVPMHSSNSANRPRTIIRPLLSGAATGQPRTVAAAASPLPSTIHGHAQNQPGRSEDMDVDDDVDVEVDDAEEAGETPFNQAALASKGSVQSGDQPASPSFDVSRAPLPDSTPVAKSPFGSRGEPTRRRLGRPAGRLPRALARDNVIGGLVGDAVADDAPHLLRAFEESTGYDGLQTREHPSKKRGGYKGGRPRGSGKGGARGGTKRRISDSDRDLHEGESAAQEVRLQEADDKGSGKNGGESSSRATSGDGDVDVSDA